MSDEIKVDDLVRLRPGYGSERIEQGKTYRVIDENQLSGVRAVYLEGVFGAVVPASLERVPTQATAPKKGKRRSKCDYCCDQGRWLCPVKGSRTASRLFFCPDCHGSGDKSAPAAHFVEHKGKTYRVVSMVVEPGRSPAEQIEDLQRRVKELEAELVDTRDAFEAARRGAWKGGPT